MAIGSLLFTTTVQVGAVLGRQLADQPLKVECGAGVAVRVTVVPGANSAEQALLPAVQFIPGGLLTIVPEPSPASKIVRVRVGAAVSSDC